MDGKTGVLETGLHRSGCNCSSCPEAAAKANALAMADVVRHCLCLVCFHCLRG